MNFNRIHFPLITLLLFIPLVHSQSGVKDIITLGITKPALESSQGRFMQAIYTEIFSEMKLKLKIEIL